MTETITVHRRWDTLRTFSLLKGQPVYETVSGTKIGEVTDLCITKSGMVKGLLVKKGVFFKQTYFLDIHDVSSFGWDGVMIEDHDHLAKCKTAPEYTLAHQHSLNGKMILSKSGESLGLLEDVYFQEELGTIVGYETTDGFFSDITEGKQVIQSRKPPAIGKDAIIVDVSENLPYSDLLDGPKG
ncbi:MAG: PRC-barrel domain-containing protein [Neobacillus sp.]